MRIIVKRSILERTLEAIEDLRRQGKEVERVIVSAAEMEDLLNCPIGPDQDDPLGQRSCFKDRELYVSGVRIVPESVDKTPAGLEQVIGPGMTVQGE